MGFDSVNNFIFLAKDPDAATDLEVDFETSVTTSALVVK